MIQHIGSAVAATFALGSFLIGVGLIYAAVKARSLTELGPAVFMFAAGVTAATRYTSPIGWICASEVLATGAYLLLLRHFSTREV
jgi:hypothetical protein